MLRHIRKPLSWIPSGPQHAAYSAALALVAIQVGIGIILKAAQTGGSYAFSPSASVAISEFFKMVLSTIFFYRECRRRAADAIRPSTRGGGSGYTTLPASDLPTTERRSSLEEKEREEGMPESGNANGGASSDANGGIGEKRMSGPLPHLDARTFWSYVRGEVTVDVRYGFANLALFYVLINNSVWSLYGNIQISEDGDRWPAAGGRCSCVGFMLTRLPNRYSSATSSQTQVPSS